jgi:NADH-quinone oxidoreductase subunit A
LYDKLNSQQSKHVIREFSLETTVIAAATANNTETATAPAIKKPMFKPAFKKPGNES